jgi:putative transposase
MACVAEEEALSMVRQCELLEVPRSSYYHGKLLPDRRAGDELLMSEIDRIYLEEPTYGSRRLCDQLKLMGHAVGRDRVRRLMREMGMEPIYSKPRLSQPGKGHKIYPYLLRNLEITDPGHVWCSDITYIPLAGGHVYLTVVMDWASRYVISWRLSNSLDEGFCVECLGEALLKEPPPEIFNTDQGSQYTGTAFTGRLRDAGVRISMDGRGRALDNRMVERLWRTVKYDDIYIRAYETMGQLQEGLKRFFHKYNNRSHQGLGRISPLEAYSRRSGRKAA